MFLFLHALYHCTANTKGKSIKPAYPMILSMKDDYTLVRRGETDTIDMNQYTPCEAESCEKGERSQPSYL